MIYLLQSKSVVIMNVRITEEGNILKYFGIQKFQVILTIRSFHLQSTTSPFFVQIELKVLVTKLEELKYLQLITSLSSVKVQLPIPKSSLQLFIMKCNSQYAAVEKIKKPSIRIRANARSINARTFKISDIISNPPLPF